jgi:hypothetical protein
MVSRTAPRRLVEHADIDAAKTIGSRPVLARGLLFRDDRK